MSFIFYKFCSVFINGRVGEWVRA